MTQTEERPATATTPDDRAEAWLAAFEDALKARDVARASGLFATTSFWRDLVAFTWNLKTVENPDGVADLLTQTLDNTDPSGFTLAEPADEADGVVTAWIGFETAVGRGNGLLRLVEEDGSDKAWTLPHRAPGAQGPRGAARRTPPDGGAARHRQGPRRPGRSSARPRPSRSAPPSSPTCS